MTFGGALGFLLGVKGQIKTVSFEVNQKQLTVQVPDDQYWISIKDLLLNREYEYASGFALNNFEGVVVDAGANSGLFSLICAQFAKKVVALEPFPENYLRLLQNVEKKHSHNLVPLPNALWHNNDSVKIFEGRHSGEHSIYSKSNRFIEAPSVTLGELTEKFGTIDLLKLDIEGAEFAVFEHLPSSVLERINAVVGEVHLEHGNLNKIVAKLEAAGFTVHTFNPPLCAKKTYPIKTRGLFRLRVLRRLLYLVPFKTKANPQLKILFASKPRSDPK